MMSIVKFFKSKYSITVAVAILTFLCLKNFFKIHESSLNAQSQPAKVVAPSRPMPVVTEVVAPSKPKQIEEQKVVNVLHEKPKTTVETPIKTAPAQNHDTVVHNTDSIKSEEVSMSWSDFASLPLTLSYEPSNIQASPLFPDFEPIMCSNDIVKKLADPRLSEQDFNWCKWALSPTGAGVVVGKSWGKLNNKEKQTFDAFNCNAAAGKNPSCDDSWGDKSIQNWLNKMVPKSSFGCNAGKTSDQTCYRNENEDVYCVLKNAQINFSKFTKYARGGTTPSKRFEQNFISTDCNEKKEEAVFPFKYLYSPNLSSQKCDYVHNGTVILYSHDDIRNLGHTLNDVFNVWIMLWLSGLGKYAKNTNMLNIDSFKLGHNFDDQPNAFFQTYYKNFHDILKGHDYGDKTLCIQEVIVQPIPPRFFIWESWFIDLPCSFIGPSSLYQRWNFHVRNSYGLLKKTEEMETNNIFKILLIVRNEKTNLWGASRTSRNFLNLPTVISALEQSVAKLTETFKDVKKFEFVALDLGTLKFEEQLKLISSSSIMIGMHGAGIASSMHMSVGTKYCCGVLEIYPKGEFSPIKGHGNMVRKMGIRYDRIDIPEKLSKSDGATVPKEELSDKIIKMVHLIHGSPTCVIPAAVYDPYLENITRPH